MPRAVTSLLISHYGPCSDSALNTLDTLDTEENGLPVWGFEPSGYLVFVSRCVDITISRSR